MLFMAASDSSSEPFELVDAESLAQDSVEGKQPDLDEIIAWLSPQEYDKPSRDYYHNLSFQAPGLQTLDPTDSPVPAVAYIRRAWLSLGQGAWLAPARV